MTVRILLAPAASGKTSYALARAREASANLQSEPRILVPTNTYKYSLRSQLAEDGGVLGVRIETFKDISNFCLSAAGDSYKTLSRPDRHQLLRYVVSRLHLDHYQPLSGKPGFFKELARIINDLKASKIWPEDLLAAVDDFGPKARLRDLGLIYRDYQSQLHSVGWVDDPGRGWLAVEALEKKAEDITSGWSLLIVDGFDSFTEVQYAILEVLASTVDETIVTLTSVTSDIKTAADRPTFQLFQKTIAELEKRLGVTAEPLPANESKPILPSSSRSPILAHLEKHLFADNPIQMVGGDAVTLTAAPDRATEVRAALRWLKERVALDNIQPHETALIARKLTPYRTFIHQIATEFSLEVHFVGDESLSSNPAIVAVLNLLELVLPRSDTDPSPALPRQGVIEAWRSPYFDWAKTQIFHGQAKNGAITPVDAEALDALARSGRVIDGLEQWDELFQPLEQLYEDDQSDIDGNSTATSAELLAAKFKGFRMLIAPPNGHHSYGDFVQWLDKLLGSNPATSPTDREGAGTLILQLRDPEHDEEDDIYQRDLQALLELKEILRSMVRVEKEIDQNKKISYSQFFSDLSGMVDAVTYRPPEEASGDLVLVTDVINAHGLTFRAVAVLGMAEGEFPKTYVEDPFLWEVDREQLSKTEGVLLDSSVESYEREYFYQTVTRPREKLLLTRPRLADSGAEWQPSPFWEEIRRIVDVQPILLTTESVPTPDKAASPSELISSLINYPRCQPALDYIEKNCQDRWSNLSRSAQIFDQRYSRDRTLFNGDLTARARKFTERFNVNYRWSPSSLESYHSCPYSFFVGRVLKLKPRDEPAEGLDAGQLGTIYHQIFEQLYRVLDPPQRTDPEKLLAILPAISRQVLDEAPARQGFRETAWWRETRQEIANNIKRSIVAMAEIQGDFIPEGFELHFHGNKALTVHEDNDRFILHGYIDRVDRDNKGQLRIIDYKTAGPYSYTKQTLENGDKIQIALYALAARDALEQGEPVDGFYWHIRQAKPSDLTLGGYGPSEAIDVAVGHAWDSVRGARQGYFVAHPPADGCPSYCPAAGFCWNFRPGMWS